MTDRFSAYSDPAYRPVPVETPAYVRAMDRTVVAGGWADPEDWTQVDFTTRPTHAQGGLRFDDAGRPLNPAGPTGRAGRLLGKWGPNHAVDPVVLVRGPAWRVLLIERQDTGALAFPGGMLDEGETAVAALARELREETGLVQAFSVDDIVHRGIVAQDPRNTDHAWMETTVGVRVLDGNAPPVQAGDDAKSAGFFVVDDALIDRLYADHGAFLRLALAHAAGGPG